MTDHDFHDPFAREETDHTAPESPAEVADAMTVHGLLSLLLPGEAQRIEARVERAAAAIADENKRFRGAFARRIAWAGGSVGIAAAILLAILFVPDLGDATAFATLESMRSSAHEAGRTYALRIVGMTPLDDRTGAGPPKPSDNAHLAQRTERPSPATRSGELVIGPRGMWTISIAGGGIGRKPHPDAPQRAGKPKFIFGYDGSNYWAVDWDGAVRKSAELKALRVPMALSAMDDGLDDPDDDPELLTLGSMLDRLDRGYEITFDATTRDDEIGGRPVTVISAKRKGFLSRAPGPNSVRVIADAQSFEVLRASWEWTNSGGFKPGDSSAEQARHPGIRKVTLTLQTPDPEAPFAASLRPDSWFTPEGHSRPNWSKPSRDSFTPRAPTTDIAP